MKTVFVDTAYWVAIARPDDQWHQEAEQARKRLGTVRMVTTDGVLTEVLASLSASPFLREKAVELVRAIISDPNIEVVPQTRDLFNKGLDRYEERSDKKFSLQDCMSMVLMEERLITDALTSDHHFEQGCFTILMKKDP